MNHNSETSIDTDIPVICTQPSNHGVAVRGAFPINKMPTADDLVTAFFAGRNPQTEAAYRQDLADFSAFAGTSTVEQALQLMLSLSAGQANALVLAYKAHLHDAGFSPATTNRRLAALRSVIKLGRTLGLVTWTLEIKNEKSQSYRDTRGPGRDGFSRLLKVAQAERGMKSIRDQALLRLLYDLALRRGEVVSLDLSHVDLATSTVSIMGKGRTQRENLSLPDPTKAAIARWLDARGDQPGPLFINMDHARKGERLTGTSIYRIVRDLGAGAGLKTRPHGLRHAAITAACKAAQANGMDLEEVLDFSRHSDVRTLMLYRDRDRNVQGRLAALVAEAG